MYDKVTRSIRVSVEPVYLENQSSPEDDYFVWAYSVHIQNEGEEVVQLKMRHWRITDGTGRTEEVRGAGVVGEQPVLGPGDAFEYTSGAPLATPTGFMVGTYQMQTSSGETFEVDIPAFSLDSPHMNVRLH